MDREEVGEVGESGKMGAGGKYYCFVPRALGSRCAGDSEDSMLAGGSCEAGRLRGRQRSWVLQVARRILQIVNNVSCQAIGLF